jgi:signal transduction histidine kinase/ActR/RegA family two-component response regulator
MALSGARAFALAALVLVTLLVLLAVLPVSPVLRQWLSDGLQLLLSLVATAYLLRAAVEASGTARSFWLLLGAATLTWAMGQALWMLKNGALGARGLFPPWDFLFLGHSFPLVVALFLRPDRKRAWSLGLALDIVVFALLVVHIGVYAALGQAFFGGPEAYSRFAARLNDYRGLAVPLLGLWLLRGGTPPWRTTYRQLAMTLVVWNLGDAYSSDLLRRGLYHPGPLDLPWTLPFLWLALAAAQGPRVASAEAASMVPDWRATRRSTALVVLATAGVCLSHLLQVLLADDPPVLVRQRSALTLVTLLAVVSLFLARQLWLLSRLEDAARAELGARVHLQRTERMSAVGMLVAGVAHEINNPLTSILGHAELLQRRPYEPADPGKIEQIREAAERCARIVRNLLLFARDTGAERRPLDLSELVRRVTEMEANELRVRGVKLQLELAASVRVVGNAGQLQQVLVNLVTNALHAISGKSGAGRLRIMVAASGPQALLEVEDDGPGILPELREEVFRPLYTTKAAGEGTGLGLAICRDIVVGHGGTLNVTSGAWRGALFRIALPLPEAPPLLESAPSPPPQDLPGLRVLVVDDEPSLRELMARVLQDAGCEITAAADGESALSALAFDPDVVVSDVRMPVMGGALLYERCRAQKPHLQERFVFITGDTASRETWQFLADSGCETLQKPFGVDTLVEAVGRVARRHGLHRGHSPRPSSPQAPS